MQKSIVAFSIFLSASAQAAQPKMGPLHSLGVQEFLKLPENYQVLYVAGAIDGMTFVSYGYALPDHDALVRCYRSKPLGEFTKEVVELAKTKVGFKENVATLVAKTAGNLCRK